MSGPNEPRIPAPLGQGVVNTKPSSMGRCKLMGTEPIFGNKTLKPLIGLSLNGGNTKDLN